MSDTRAQGRRFDRIEVEICWAAIELLDIADKLTLLRELATEFAASGLRRGSEHDKVVAAVLSLRTAAEVMGRSLSQYEYRRMQIDLPELELVPDGTLRRWLGGASWNECLSRALLDAVTDGDFLTAAKGDLYTEEELVKGIREYMSDHEGQVPTYSQLVVWARSPDVRARSGRRPLSNGPFARFGGYRAVLERNGLVSSVNPRFDLRGRMLPCVWRYTDDELRTAVSRVAAKLGRAPRETEYRDARARQSEALRARRELPAEDPLPSVSILKQRLGPSWSNVLDAAGQPTAHLTRQSRRKSTQSTKPYRQGELIEAVKAAWIAQGEPFTKPAYQAWRQSMLAVEGSARIPSVEVICRTFRGWPEACEACLPASWTRRRRRRKTYPD